MSSPHFSMLGTYGVEVFERYRGSGTDRIQ
jgi:hypothetical protein